MKSQIKKLAVGMAPPNPELKNSSVMAGQTPQPYLCPDKRGDNGKGPLPKTANGEDRFVKLKNAGR